MKKAKAGSSRFSFYLHYGWKTSFCYGREQLRVWYTERRSFRFIGSVYSTRGITENLTAQPRLYYHDVLRQMKICCSNQPLKMTGGLS